MSLGKLIELESLPSKGIPYPKEIEIHVKPLSIKEEIEMSRFGQSQAEYYEILLKNISISGDYDRKCFDKKDLLLGDVQFIDLARRLLTFDEEEEVNIKDVKCKSCDKELPAKFSIAETEFTDYNPEVFDKKYTFTDGMEITIAPITIGNFMSICRKYITNRIGANANPDVSDFIIAYYTRTVKSVEGKVYESNETMYKYLFKYFSELYKNKDKKILDQISYETHSTVIPFNIECLECGEKTEVYLEPTMRFHQ